MTKKQEERNKAFIPPKEKPLMKKTSKGGNINTRTDLKLGVALPLISHVLSLTVLYNGTTNLYLTIISLSVSYSPYRS